MNTKPYYECHITFPFNSVLKSTVESLKWKYSAIVGDPSLGDKVFSYATRHYGDDVSENFVIENIQKIATEIANLTGVRSIRCKVEHIVWDSRTV